MGEKPWSTQFSTIHRCHEICQVGIPFVHNLLTKTPIGLFKSCRGMLDLQLCLLHLGALQFKFLEFHSVKQGYSKCSAGARRYRSHATRRRRATPCAAAGDPRHGPDTNVEAPWAPRGKRRGIGRRSHRHPSPLPLCRARTGQPRRSSPLAQRRRRLTPPVHAAMSCPYRERVDDLTLCEPPFLSPPIKRPRLASCVSRLHRSPSPHRPPLALPKGNSLFQVLLP
jgi:hypothetical protein